MGKFGEVVYGSDVTKPTEKELEETNKDKDTEIKNRPDGTTIITTKELPEELKEGDKKSMEETLKKHGVDTIQ
jgi:hypothetical protein